MWPILGILTVLVVGYGIYQDDKNAPTPEQQKVLESEWIARDVKESCIKGVLYYYTSGPHSARMAPAIDQASLQFIRCKG